MKKSVVVNVYNFIRKSHEEPSRFIQDDFDTIQKQMETVRQYGFPATYALKYDALTDERYQALLLEETGEEDEISAWWEITQEMCDKAGVRFRGVSTEEFDERVNSAYSIGYEPEERKRLVDAYMDTFWQVFGFYPKTIGSWVLDTVTLEYAAQRYGVIGGATCRDQIGTDGFTLWGGYPNGVYYPSRMNENIPAQTIEHQLSIPVFRLLGPDPIYNFEQNLRSGLHGMVFTLEPVWLTGRDKDWIHWMFESLSEENTLGISYAQIGQENNFLWENIEPGFAPQLSHVKALAEAGKLRVETMAKSAEWFCKKYRMTPPMSWQASKDWNSHYNLCAQWYASGWYRIGFLGEEQHLRVRDMFLYRETYRSRYFEHAMADTKSIFDALPVLYPQLWGNEQGRPFIRLMDQQGEEPSGTITFDAKSETEACAELTDSQQGTILASFCMKPDQLYIKSEYFLTFDKLPVFQKQVGRQIYMEHESFSYCFTVEIGEILKAGRDGVQIAPERGRICLRLGKASPVEELYTLQYLKHPQEMDATETIWKKMDCVPPLPPQFYPEECVFPYGSTATITLFSQQEGQVHYTTDGSFPDENSPVYTKPIPIDRDTVFSAQVFLPDGRKSETVSAQYSFGLTEMTLKSPTVFDPREVFNHNGVYDLLVPERGTCDYQCGRWLGTLEDLDVVGILPEERKIEEISLGFLSHHRSGIVFPEKIELFIGTDEQHLVHKETMILPCAPCPHEIQKKDFVFTVNEQVRCFRIIAHRYAKMPQWCTYKGVSDVFMMADTLIVKPK